MTPGFVDELQKIAARAGLKIIKRLAEKGTPEALEQASRIARSGALTVGRAAPGAAAAGGHQVKRLGQGAEGLVDLVAHPEYGVVARKVYDPTGFSKQRMIGRKIRTAMQHADDPEYQQMYAQMKGYKRSPEGVWSTFSEYSPPTKAERVMTMPTGTLRQRVSQSLKSRHPEKYKDLVRETEEGGMRITPELIASLPPGQRELLKREMAIEPYVDQVRRRSAQRFGFDPGDVRAPNISGGKIVDHMPYQRGEYHGQGGLFRETQLVDPAKTKTLIRPDAPTKMEDVRPAADFYRLLGLKKG